MFSRCQMWNKKICQLYTLIKKPTDIFKQKYRKCIISNTVTLREVRFQMQHKWLYSSSTSKLHEYFLIEAIYKKLVEFESL